MTCAPSEYSDQAGHPHNMIRAFAVRMKNPCVLGYPLSAQRAKTQIRLGGSDWADAQADLSLRWAHRLVCRFCHVAAHLYSSYVYGLVRMGCGLRIKT